MQHRYLQTVAGRLTVPELGENEAGRLSITWHWAASSYTVSQGLKQHYHFVIGKDGKAHQGVPIENNLAGPQDKLPNGYAAHVKLANRNNIGISAAAMAGAQEHEARQGRYGPYPMTAEQVAGMVEVAAQLCAHYGIPVLPSRVLGHEEWDSVLGRPQDRWDVNCIPHLELRPRLNPDGTYASTNLLRAQTAARVAELAQEVEPELHRQQLEVFRKFVAFMDAAEAAQFPPITLRLIRQVRYEPPLSMFAREDLEHTDG